MTNTTPVTLTVDPTMTPPTVLAILGPDPEADGIKSVTTWQHAEQLANGRELIYSPDELDEIEKILGKR